MSQVMNALRSALRRHQHPRLAPPAILSHPFSSSAVANNKPAFGEVRDMLTESANIQEEEPVEAGRVKASMYEKKMLTPTRRPAGIPGSLLHSRYLRPADLTRERVAERPRYIRRGAILGPSAAESKQRDIFYQLNLDPLHESINSTLMSKFVTQMGKIKGRADNNLTWKNQRRLGKAIRRAKMMGIIPVLSNRTLHYVPKDKPI